jgi:cytochrome c oxidase subunit 2
MPSALTICLLAVLPAAAHAQIAALEPAGDLAAQTLAITNVLFIGGGVIFAVVMLVLGMAMLGPARLRAALSHRRWLVGAGIVFPVGVLSALLVYTFGAASAMVTGQQAPAATRIEVAAELWWWRVRYLDERGNALFETANEIRIPAGEPVQLELVSPNVIHSFWVPALAGKIDMIPGRVNRMRLRATAPGTYRGQCAEYCGGQHAKMAFHVVALARDEYAGWFAQRRDGTAGAGEQPAARGRDLFARSGCGLCHAVRGTDAAGTIGPDLTDVGSREWLAAGTLRNSRTNMARWIGDSQALKPGSRMPAYRQFSTEELGALADYLGSLR